MALSREHKLLGIIIIVALLLRVLPVFLYGVPIGYDSPYHIRMAELISAENALPAEDPALGGRAYNYPPLYHILIYGISSITGTGIETVVAVLLPLISVLVVLSIFVFVRRAAGTKNAIIAAALAAFVSTFVSAAFDSPENFVFFILPFSILLVIMKKPKLAGFSFAICILFNYLAFAVSVIPLYLAFIKERAVLKYATAFIAAFAALLVFVFGVEETLSKSISSGTDFVANNLAGVMPSLIFESSIIAIIILIYAFRKVDTTAMKYWYYYSLVSLAALYSYFVTFIFRSWEQPKFLAFGIVMVIGLTKFGKANRIYSYFLTLLVAGMFLLSVVTSAQLVYPKVTTADYSAISWIEKQEFQGTLLTEPTFSEVIMNSTNLDEKLLTALHYEADASNLLFVEALKFLGDINNMDELGFLERSNLEYMLLNFEDQIVRGTEHFDSKPYLNKVYSMHYYESCPFVYLPVTEGFACGVLETKIYQVN